MDIYRLMRFAGTNGLPPTLKVMGLWVMHMLGKRTLGIFIDPVMACNLRCKMCYFSDPVKRATMKGFISNSRLDSVEKAFFHRALKLQIGCGAEPTLYNDLSSLIQRGKKCGIPYITLTTNGLLINNNKVNLKSLVEVGLNEITLSLHGTTPEVYEYLMPGAKFNDLISSLNAIAEVKRTHKNFRFRINYTINSMNVADLVPEKFWKLFENSLPDIIQLRLVQKIGNTEWNDFDLSKIRECYDDTIGAIGSRCKELGVVFMAPSRDNLEEVETEQSGSSATMEDLAYCYVSPVQCYHPDFNLDKDSYESYHKRSHTAAKLFRLIFNHKVATRSCRTTKKLNYKVKY